MRVSSLSQYLSYQLYHALLLVNKIGTDDSEYLHQFRVSLRRVRSLLKLYSPPEILFPKALKALLRSTNSLRELDVFIDSLDPKWSKKGIKELQRIRTVEYETRWTEPFRAELRDALQSFYDRVMEVNPFIEEKELIANAKEYYDVTTERYRALSPNASEKELHALRIDFKISRYGLEFISESSLEDEKAKISECKRLQSRLGEIQDLANQVQWLKKFVREHPLQEFQELLDERKKKLKKLKGSSR